MSRAPVKCKYHTAVAIKEAERQWKKLEIDEKMKKSRVCGLGEGVIRKNQFGRQHGKEDGHKVRARPLLNLTRYRRVLVAALIDTDNRISYLQTSQDLRLLCSGH